MEELRRQEEREQKGDLLKTFVVIKRKEFVVIGLKK